MLFKTRLTTIVVLLLSMQTFAQQDSLQGKAQSNNPLKNGLDKEVEKLVRPYIQKSNTAGLILAVIHKGKVYRYSYGTVDKKRKELPKPSTLFEIGSITKTFTSLLLAEQVLEGKMSLDDPINRYLPDSVKDISANGMPVRLVHLANHTSGFPRLPANIFQMKVDRNDPYRNYVHDSLYSYLVRYQATTPPGQVYAYSNFGAGLLGVILERQLGAGFQTLVEERICKPLKMFHTFIDIPTGQAAAFAQGYNELGLPASPWDLGSLKGAGALRSTLDDMVLYLKAQLGAGNDLAKAIVLTHEPTFTGPGQQMALGWLIGRHGENVYYQHSGGTGGYRSFAGFSPEQQFAVVILSNAAEDVTPIGQALSAFAEEATHVAER
ncbi:serine hydrolase domain-containing protein [Chitinophaga cymbidii]|uniref:Beta-lactamase-related domain-containing protein n=1 Tax=Chitinophaga cymbidii TaxID=1096750 RepID=A0A512RQR9_9BACT|nr:serine hydrolase domain-containing protein [Chitinophaga cymbidii]GEP98053.1 hypothetical protein CCY01nite_43130 [Chitinophaga cymbidii]